MLVFLLPINFTEVKISLFGTDDPDKNIPVYVLLASKYFFNAFQYDKDISLSCLILLLIPFFIQPLVKNNPNLSLHEYARIYIFQLRLTCRDFSTVLNFLFENILMRILLPFLQRNIIV